MDSPSVSWKALPLSILVEIFDQLDLNSRRNASLTCKGWADIFKHPKLWNFLSLEFSNRQCNFVCCKGEMSYAVVSHCYQSLKHLMVTWDLFELQPQQERLVFMIADFFNSLVNNCKLPQLKSLCLNGYVPESNSEFVRSENVDSLIISVVRFLRTQKSLEEVWVMWELCTFHQALLIDAVAGSSAQSLCTLEIASSKGFCPLNRNPSVFGLSFQSLSNLKKLQLSYENFGEMALDSIINHCKKLHCLTLTVERSYLTQVSGEPHRISPMKWKRAAETLPDLEVTFIMTIPSDGYWPWNMNVFERLLPKTVPLVEFVSHECKLDEKCIFYLLHFSGTLKILELVCLQEVNAAVFDVLSRCSELKAVKLVGDISFEIIDLLQLRMLQLAELKVVYLFFNTSLESHRSAELMLRRNSIPKDLKWLFTIIMKSEIEEFSSALEHPLHEFFKI